MLSIERREAKKGFGDDVPEQVWAAAQRPHTSPYVPFLSNPLDLSSFFAR